MSRMEYDEMVRFPGKFEAEPSYVPYFWDKLMDGAADDEFYDADRPMAVFYVEESDRELFPELDFSVLVLWEDDNGFVNRAEYESDEEFDEDRARIEEEDAARSDEEE